jgi:hypothetical protein
MAGNLKIVAEGLSQEEWTSVEWESLSKAMMEEEKTMWTEQGILSKATGHWC